MAAAGLTSSGRAGSGQPLGPTPCFEIAAKRGLAVTVDASCSRGTGDLDYSWEWGDGSVSNGGPQTMHVYSVCPSGRFEIVLTVTDDTAPAATSRTVAVTDGDRDGDRLARCLEQQQGTSDRTRDWDGDGLTDLVESVWWNRRDSVYCGRACAYPDPIARDIYVEVDRMRTPDGHPHSHRIAGPVVDAITEEFARNQVLIHVDQGRFGGGEALRHDTYFSWDSSKTDHADRYYNSINGRGFTQERRGIFHYVVVAHTFAGDPGCDIVGLGEAPTGHEKRYGDFVVIFRACLDGYGDEAAGLVHVLLQELGHNLFGLIQPEGDRFPCPRTTGVDPWHDRFHGYAMWPYLGGGGRTYHPNRWAEDMDDMDRSIREKLGARYHVNKLFIPGPSACG